MTESVGESSKATKSADEPKRIPGADGTASAAGKGRPAAHLLVIGEREALVWVLTEQRMAFPANRAREALALVPGDLLFIYTTRGCFHNPTRDPSRVIGEATVKSPVRPLKDAVVFGARAFPIGCRLSIKRCAPWGRGVELRPLVPKISAFPDPATWSARMRSALVPLGRDDVVLLRNALKSVVAEPRAVVPSYRAMLPHRAA